MKRTMQTIFCLLTCVLGVSAFAQSDSVIISPMSIILNPVPSFEVQVWVDKDPSGQGTPSYNIGDPISIGVRTNTDAFIYLFNVRANNTVVQIMPNRYDAAGANNFMRAGETRTFPPVGAQYTFSVDGPLGLDKVIAVASRRELAFSELSRFEADPNFATSYISEQSFAQALSVVINPIPQDVWVSDTALFYVGPQPSVPQYGTLSFGSNPAGARVFVNEQFVGYTPGTFGTTVGQYTVRMELPNHVPFVQNINVSGGQTVPISSSFQIFQHQQPVPQPVTLPVQQPVQYQPVQQPVQQPMQQGYAQFFSTPAGATVTINGQVVGVTPTSPIVFTPGSYQARYSLAGHQETVVNFTIAANVTQRVESALLGQTAATGFGTLLIHMTVPNARVAINGIDYGTITGSTGRVSQIASGRHLLTVSAPGFSPYITEIEIRAGQTTEVRPIYR